VTSTSAFAFDFDYFPDGATCDCADCGTPIRLHVAPYRYLATDVRGGQQICQDCLAATSPNLAMIAKALELIALVSTGSDEMLALAQRAVSMVRRVTQDRTMEAVAAMLHGPGTEPKVVHVTHSPVCDDSDLYVWAHLHNGKPRVSLTDPGGWPFLDDDPDAAIAVADQIRDVAVVARMAAELDSDT
jgi:hypothetical protein